MKKTGFENTARNSIATRAGKSADRAAGAAVCTLTCATAAVAGGARSLKAALAIAVLALPCAAGAAGSGIGVPSWNTPVLEADLPIRQAPETRGAPSAPSAPVAPVAPQARTAPGIPSGAMTDSRIAILRGNLGPQQIQASLRPKVPAEEGVEGSYFIFGGKDNILLAGEIDGETLLMEESENGIDVSGQWDGIRTGDTIEGTWRSADGASTKPFLLKIMPAAAPVAP